MIPRIRLVALLCLLSISPRVESQPSITAKFLFRSHSAQGIVLPYRLFVPEGMVPGVRYPIVLALHGDGGRGTDNRSHIEAIRLATVWADPVNQATYPCFVVAPQCPPTGLWYTDSPFLLSTPMSATVDMLDSLMREFPIDTNRQYVTGLSGGAFGTWALLFNLPARFAAAAPVCGRADPAGAPIIRDVPIWNFHGAVDDLVPVQRSRVMIEALEREGRRPVYTNCRYRDCRGLPDSVVASAVGWRQDLLYTEYRGSRTTPGIRRTTSPSSSPGSSGSPGAPRTQFA